ncbi:peptidoglycan-binding protein [Streptomyces sp. Ag109_G2-15]|uniref:peptidoglycan-binding domain-containing protein n=1 Tax=Streptomyces sp. Ag109_G2-15 TaxID=1938850 RepID=UPI000BC58305|nr:peptidoglycan-binding protein [Streptomyces sp. Ag109_G2-15]SOD82166.1 Putative peptidoglycan binding domain-containing protein [Streptomyces sp. Ag109_G2-15]
MGERTTARAALCVLILAVACAGSGASLNQQSHDRRGSVLVADGLGATQQLAVGRTRRSDLIGLWQSVLWADGYSARSSVTCTYDKATAEATRVWQSNHHLSADGIVGPATWGAAAERIVPVGQWMVYQGERYGLPLRPDPDGVYEVYDTGRFHRLRTNAVTLTRCR